MKIKKWKFIWLLLTNSFFRWELAETLQYAINIQSETRGSGAADVLAFEMYFYNKVVESERAT